jgi:SAM-dependent methyltransferase
VFVDPAIRCGYDGYMRSPTLRAPVQISQVEAIDRTLAYYEANAVAYAAETLGAAVRPRVELFARQLGAGARVVDLGCGAGRDLRLLADFGLKPVGLDLSGALAALARGYSQQPVVVGDLRLIPFRSEAFDGAWASASLLHLPRHELPRALAECRRVLKRGAPLAASVKLGRGAGTDETGRWYTYFFPDDWAGLLRASGFSDIIVDTDEELRSVDDVIRRVPWLKSFSRAV